MLTSLSVAGGRTLLISEYRQDSRNWVVFLPGSSAELWTLNGSERGALLKGLSANLLVINKPGVRASGRVNHREFERSFRRPQRIQDYLEVLRARIPHKNKIAMLGFSEGAYLAPEIALKDSRVRALSLVSGGTRGWLDEEIYKPSAKKLLQVFKRVGDVYARPNSTSRYWYGIPYATWTSYDNDNTWKSLKKLSIPILAIHGSKDVLIDLDSARNDLMELKLKGHPLSLRYYEGVDHTLGRLWKKALRATNAFIVKNL